MSETTTNPPVPDDPDRRREVTTKRREMRAVWQRPDSTPLEREVVFTRWAAAAHRQAMERRVAQQSQAVGQAVW